MSKFFARAILTLGIWTAASAILAFGVLGGNAIGNAAVVIVPVAATILTVAPWKWGARISHQLPDANKAGNP